MLFHQVWTKEEKATLLVTQKLDQAQHFHSFIFHIQIIWSMPQTGYHALIPLLQVRAILNRDSHDHLQKLFDISSVSLLGVSRLCALQTGQDVPVCD